MASKSLFFSFLVSFRVGCKQKVKELIIRVQRYQSLQIRQLSVSKSVRHLETATKDCKSTFFSHFCSCGTTLSFSILKNLGFGALFFLYFPRSLLHVVDASPSCRITMTTTARKVLTISDVKNRRYSPTIRFSVHGKMLTMSNILQSTKR